MINVFTLKPTVVTSFDRTEISNRDSACAPLDFGIQLEYSLQNQFLEKNKIWGKISNSLLHLKQC